MPLIFKCNLHVLNIVTKEKARLRINSYYAALKGPAHANEGSRQTINRFGKERPGGGDSSFNGAFPIARQGKGFYLSSSYKCYYNIHTSKLSKEQMIFSIKFFTYLNK